MSCWLLRLPKLIDCEPKTNDSAKLLWIRESCPEVILASEMETKLRTGFCLSADEKIKLFRSLFREREDMYAVRWEGKNGKSGYSPACAKTRYFASKSERAFGAQSFVDSSPCIFSWPYAEVRLSRGLMPV